MLVEGMKRVEAAGYDIVLTIYDEVVAEAPDLGDEPGFDHVEMEDLLATPPDWAPDLPLAAGGFETDRYRKD